MYVFSSVLHAICVAGCFSVSCSQNVVHKYTDTDQRHSINDNSHRVAFMAHYNGDRVAFMAHYNGDVEGR